MTCRHLGPIALAAILISSTPAAGSNCANTSTGLIPLTDLGSGFYQGYQGGLYPGGSNDRPALHTQAGINLGYSVDRLNTAGVPDPDGQVVFISIGMSNCFLEFRTFMNWVDGDPAFDQSVRLINCAQGGQVAETIVDPNAAYWSYVNSELAAKGSSPEQVQVIWFKNANRLPSQGFPAQTEALSRQLGTIMQLLKQKFPNVKQVFMSSRSYGGYASIALNPEPYAYEAGFAFKWIIEAQIAGEDSLNYDPAAGPVRAPWLSWGPYFWADGLTPRTDGLTWSCSDFDTLDGTHPNPTGQNVASSLMRSFFLSDPAVPWFRSAISAAPDAPAIPRLRAEPNPARSRVAITLPPGAAATAIDILDVSGRRIRRLAPNDSGEASWDLRTDGGRRVSDGLYWARPIGSAPSDAATIGTVRIVVTGQGS